MKELFLLRPDITFLNHGSFGACPRPVFEVYQQWQRELELQPVEFLGRRFESLMLKARIALADFLHTAKDNVVYIPNATTGINMVARSLTLGTGDEILATDHEYGAIDRTWKFLCHKTGASYIRHPMPLPFTTATDFVEQFWQAVTPRTKVISLSHITSPTAMTFPLQEICQRARAAGILTVIDGAHAPGQIPLHLDELGADFYSGNCHKWLCAPKGAAFLYSRPEMQHLVEPLLVSWGWESRAPTHSQYIDWHEYQGTKDLAPYLSVPAAIEFQRQHNWQAVQARCHKMLTELRQKLLNLTGLPDPYPSDPAYQWYVQMAIIPVPPCNLPKAKAILWDDYKIELPGTEWNNQQFIRVSVQAYNTPADLEHLVESFKKVF